MRVVSLSLLVVSLLATACAAPSSQEGSVIAARSDAWEQAFQAGDLESLVGFYTNDTRFMPPNAEMAEGHDAVRAILGGLIDAGLTGELTSVEAVVAGDVGYNVGRYTLQTRDGQPADRGKFIEIWRLVDGEWKISNDTFNSDLPATGAGTTLIGVHEVKDAEAWKAAWRGEGSRHELFANHGAPNVRVFQSAEHPNFTGLVIQVEDIAAFEAMLASPEGVAAAKADGVRTDTIRILAEVPDGCPTFRTVERIEPMAKITGIGGVFFKSDDPKQTLGWYAEHLGLIPEEWGGHVFHWRLAEDAKKRGYAAWSPFAPDADKFEGFDQTFMVNYRVDDLATLLDQMRAKGVRVVGELEEHPNGKFAWIVDRDGRKVELWEPVDSDEDPYL